MSGAPEAGKHFFSISFHGETFQFASDRTDVLEKCLKSQYGSVEDASPGAAAPGKKLYIRRRGVAGTVRWDDEPERFILGSEQEDSFLSFRDGIGEAVIESRDDQDLARLMFSAITTFVQLALRSRGLYAFHGAAVSLGGEGILIGGPNGSGKSTLMRRLLAAGAEYLADDAVFVRLGKIPPMICRTPELLNAADLSAAERMSLIEKGFSEIAGSPFLAPPPEILESPLKKLLFPSIVKGEHSVLSLTRKEGFLKLLKLRRTPLLQEDMENFFESCAGMAEEVCAASVYIQEGKIPSAVEAAEICGFM